MKLLNQFMSLFGSLGNLKKLFPAGVVGASVAITIKLLTVATTPTSNLFDVKAEQDIMEVEEYQEELEKEPEPEEETPPPEEPSADEPEEEVEEAGEETEEEEGEAESSSGEENEKEEEKEKEEEEQKPNLKIRDDLPGGLGSILVDLLGGGGKD